MSFWLRYILRSLARGRRRVFFALICISVGVGSVVALQTATLTVQNALTSNVRAANGGDVSVSSDATPLSSRDLAVFRRLQRQGRITQWTAIYGLHATSVGDNHRLVPFDMQVVSPSYPIGGQPTFVSPANATVAGLLQHPGDVLVTSVLADEMGIGLGSRVFVHTIGGRGLHATVRGILAETSFEHAAVMTVHQRDAARLSTAPPHYASVYVNTPDSVGIGASLRNRFPVANVQTVQEALNAARQQVHDFQQFMLLVGLMALLVAGIGILNAMQSMLAFRRLEIAMLKAIGFRHWTLYGLFGGEALLIGLLGGVSGTILGAITSKLITDALAKALAIQVDFKLDPGTLLGGVALGVGATLVFSVLPIVRAAAFRPLELLREGQEVAARGVPQTAGLLVLVLLLFAALAAAIMGNLMLAAEFVGAVFLAFGILTGAFSVLVGFMGRLGPPKSMPISVGILVLLLAASVLAIVRAPAVAALLVLASILWTATVVLPTAWLLPLLIAARSLSRRRTRTSITLVAFLVGVLAMSITLTVALGLRGQINTALASAGSTNLVALTGPADEPTVAATTRRLPGIQSSSVFTVIQTVPTAINGRSVASVLGPVPNGSAADDSREPFLLSGVNGIDLGSGQQPSGVDLVSGRMLGRQDAGTAHAMVRSALEDPPWNLRLGNHVTLSETGTSNRTTIQVIGFYRRPRLRRGFGSFFTAPIFSDRPLTVALGGTDTQWVTNYTVTQSKLTSDATQLQAAVPGALVINIGDLTAVVDTILNELLNLLAVITALALGAGLAVVGNGVALSMLERRREIALFKAVGFSPRNVLQFVLVENALAGTLAGAVSVLMVVVTLGLISHFALTRAIGFDPVIAVLVLLGATVLAVTTAYLAARTAVRVRPLEALRNE
jgi:predicted lysophospholipase L1 biosynthesis ABC-type transport system permease subunit